MDPEINKLRLAKEENLKYREEQNLLKIKADKVYIIIKKAYNSTQNTQPKQLNEYLSIDNINPSINSNHESEERNKKIIQPIGSNFE